MKNIVIFLIQIYKKFITPALRPIFGDACRFTPTCSTYTIQSIEKYGVIRGVFLGFKRILKCNSWTNL